MTPTKRYKVRCTVTGTRTSYLDGLWTYDRTEAEFSATCLNRNPQHSRVEIVSQRKDAGKWKQESVKAVA